MAAASDAAAVVLMKVTAGEVFLRFAHVFLLCFDRFRGSERVAGPVGVDHRPLAFFAGAALAVFHAENALVALSVDPFEDVPVS